LHTYINKEKYNFTIGFVVTVVTIFLIFSLLISNIANAKPIKFDDIYIDKLLNGKAWEALRGSSRSGDLDSRKTIEDVILRILNFDDSSSTEFIKNKKLIREVDIHSENINKTEVWEINAKFDDDINFNLKVSKKYINLDIDGGQEMGRGTLEKMAWDFDHMLGLGIVPPVAVDKDTESNTTIIYSLFAEDTVSDNYRLLSSDLAQGLSFEGEPIEHMGVEFTGVEVIDWLFGNTDRITIGSAGSKITLAGIDVPARGIIQDNFLIDPEGFPIAINNESLLSATIPKYPITNSSLSDFFHSYHVYERFLDYSHLGEYTASDFMETYLLELPKDFLAILEAQLAQVNAKLSKENQIKDITEMIAQRWNAIADQVEQRWGISEDPVQTKIEIEAEPRQQASRTKDALALVNPEDKKNIDISELTHPLLEEQSVRSTRGDSIYIQKSLRCNE